MPFRSRAQQAFAFATGQPWAKRWAKETNFAKLPKRVRKKLKDAGVVAGPPVAGPGGLLGTPGMGRKWGNRNKHKACTCATNIATKESLGPGITRIRGNLCNVHGRYGRCPGAPAKGATPKKGRTPRATPEQRQADNAALRRDRRDQVLADMGIDPGASEALVMLRNGEQPQPEALARAGAIEAGLVERAADGSYRMTPSGRALIAAAEAGDPGRAGDVISAARDRKAARTAREREAAQKKVDAANKRAEAAAAKKPKGGSSSGSDREAERQNLRQIRESERQADRKKREDERQADRAKREAERQEDRATRARERAEDRAAMLEERRARQRSAPVARASNPIRMPRNPRTNAVRAKAYEPTRVGDAGHSGVMVALYPDAAAAQAIAGADGVTEPQDQLHLTLCSLGDSTEQPLATNKERVIQAVAEWAQQHGQPLQGVVNGLGRFFHSESDDTNAVYVAPDVPGLPELRQSLVNWIEQSGFDYSQEHGFTPHITVAYVPADAPTPDIRVDTPVTFERVVLAWGDEQYDFPVRTVVEVDQSQFAGYTMEDWDDTQPDSFYHAKSFTVYKDHTGAHRWLARSTTAYLDRDREILPIATLDADSQRMTATKQFGPLRWWHLGKPDPFNATEPWGWGLDLGDCDFSTQIGTTRVESGTFRDPAVAARIAKTADQYELSPGFFHAYGEQGPPDGIYQQLRTFERSLVPTRYGRASNLFTGLTVKEFSMDPNEMERRFKAAIEQLGLSHDQAQALAGGLVQTDKSAQAQGVTYKSDDAPQVFTAPDGTQGLIVDGRFVALKAAEVAEVKADMPPEEMIEAGETEVADGEAEEDAEYVGDMAPTAFRALLIDAFSEAINQFGAGISGKMTEMDDALKAMGYARMKSEQDASAQATEIAALKARLAQLEGDQPAAVLPADVAAALKGAPAAPPDPNAPHIPDDAPALTHLAARTMPALYQTNPQGGFQGWIPPTPLPSQS